jgi:hypothetical protein
MGEFGKSPNPQDERLGELVNTNSRSVNVALFVDSKLTDGKLYVTPDGSIVFRQNEVFDQGA